MSATLNEAELSPYLEDEGLPSLRTSSSQEGESVGGPSEEHPGEVPGSVDPRATTSHLSLISSLRDFNRSTSHSRLSKTFGGMHIHLQVTRDWF